MSDNSERENHFALHEAAREHKTLTVRGLIRENPKSVLKRDLDGRVPLHWAVSAGDKEIVSMLLNPWHVANAEQKAENNKKFNKFDIEIDELTDDSGWTPLHIAAALGDLDILELLVNNDPEPSINQQTNTGQTALHLSVSKNLYETTLFLLKHGASARIRDRKGQYPLFRAASIGSIKLVDLLVKEGKSQLNAKDAFNWTAMHHALAEGHGDVAVELVKLGADPNVEGDGQTPVQVSVDQKVEEYFRHQLKELGVELQLLEK